MDNYQIAMGQAQKLFASLDGNAIQKRWNLPGDEAYLYPVMLGSTYRLRRRDGFLQRQESGIYQDANRFDDVMVLLDLLCTNTVPVPMTGSLKSTQQFGMQFHRNLLENTCDPLAELSDRHPEKLTAACQALGGRVFSQGDIGYTLPLFGPVELTLAFWHSDEEFSPRMRFFWDESAIHYLKYETMHYAISLLRQALQEQGLREEN